MNLFESLGLKAPVLKAITDLGFETPTPIQQQAIPYLLNEKTDLVGLAQTGTGKTAAFGLPIIHHIDFTKKNAQALIICPTRELCLQITRDLSNYSKHCEGANIVAIYGGASIHMQIREIKRGVQVIVATPGRMVDVIERGAVKLNEVKYLVLDEADEMLNMGFKEDLDLILEQTPEEKQTLLFSATMPQEVSRIAHKYMRKPHEIAVARQSQSAENIEHRFYVVHERDRYAALKRIVDDNPDIFGIVFCRTKIDTQQIADKLIKDGYNADALHGDLSQQQRDIVMDRYRRRSLQLLVATDVAARGIDVNNVTHVLNYTLPDDPEVYTHRSGRTARAGKSGVSVVLINSKELGKIKMVERIIKKNFVKSHVPSGFEVCEKQLFHLVNRIHDVEVNEEEVEGFLPKVYETLQDLTKEDLIKRMVSVEFNKFLEYYRDAQDLNIDLSKKGDKKLPPFQRMFINLGTMDGFDPEKLATYVAEICRINPKEVQRISIREKFAFFNMEGETAEVVMQAFKKERFKGRNIRVDITEDRDGGGGVRNRGQQNDFREKKFSGGNRPRHFEKDGNKTERGGGRNRFNGNAKSSRERYIKK